MPATVLGHAVVRLPTSWGALLLPRTDGAAAARAAAQLEVGDEPTDLVAARARRLALRAGATRLLPEARSWAHTIMYLQGRLDTILGTPALRLGFRIHPDDDVLTGAAVRPQGASLLGIVKVGWDPISRGLIDNEARTLAALGARRAAPTCRVPTVLGMTRDDGVHVLALSSLVPAASSVRASRELPLTATFEIALTSEVRRERLVDTSGWARVRAHVDTLGADSPSRAALQRLVDRVEAELGDHELLVGRAHGDWRDLNLTVVDGVVHARDWGHALEGVPVGLDAVHLAFDRAGRLDGSTQERVRMAVRSSLPHARRVGVDEDDLRVALVVDLISTAARNELRGVPADDATLVAASSALDGWPDRRL